MVCEGWIIDLDCYFDLNFRQKLAIYNKEVGRYKKSKTSETIFEDCNLKEIPKSLESSSNIVLIHTKAYLKDESTRGKFKLEYEPFSKIRNCKIESAS